MELPEYIKEKLSGTGVSTAFVRERLEIKTQQAMDLLRAAGARQQSGNWRIPSLERNEAGWRRLSRKCKPGQFGE